MRFIYDNVAVILVAIVAGSLGWLFGGTRAEWLVPCVPWFALLLIEVLLFFPQKRSDRETTSEARQRVWEGLKNDRLTWFSVALIVLLAIPFANNGLCVGCDWELIAQGFRAEPPVKLMPFCVNRLHHLNVFLWFVAAVCVTLVVRHSLCRRGKRLVLSILVWNGALLALLGFIQIVTGAEGPYWQEMANVTNASTFFSTFGYPNMAGDYFTSLFGISLALWRNSESTLAEAIGDRFSESAMTAHKRFWIRHIYMIPAVIFYFAAVSTLSRAAIILVNVLLVIIFVHSIISMTHHMSKQMRVKRGTIAVVAIGVVTFFAAISVPDDLQKELDTLNSDVVLVRMTGKGQYHVRVATEVWKDHKLFGCGGWGYKHFCIPKMTEAEIKDLQKIGGVNVHNDYLQFLAEHGLVGFGLMIAIVVMLIKPIVSSWIVLVKTANFTDKKKAPPKPVQLFALPAPAFFILLTVLATFIHGFADCPLRSPAVLTLFCISLAAIPGFLPKDTQNVES